MQHSDQIIDTPVAQPGASSVDAGLPDASSTSSASLDSSLPDWLSHSENYQPGRDRDGFIAKSLLSMTGVLARLRLDDGVKTGLSPSAGCKIACGFVCILLTSLTRNYAFVLVMLALVLVRMATLPGKILRRTASVAFTAAALSFLLMLPAILLGQRQSALLVGTKVLVTVSLAMIVAGTTPFHELTAALRGFHVPDVAIMTVDLALRSIARLGRLAIEVLTALRLRSIGVNDNKGGSAGGVGGVLFLKSAETATVAHDAMVCRGFTGEYRCGRSQNGSRHADRYRRAPAFVRACLVDLAWAAATMALALLYFYLQPLT